MRNGARAAIMMNCYLGASLFTCAFALGPVLVVAAQPAPAEPTLRDDARRTTSASPAQQRIEAARRVLATDKKRSDAWNELALNLARRARETADPN